MADKSIALFQIKGRFGVDNPFECPEDQVIEAMNVDFYRSSFIRKRRGATNVPLTGVFGASDVVALHTHLPTDEYTNRELWAVTEDGFISRKAGAADWTEHVPVAPDNIAVGQEHLFDAVSFNGKLFMAYTNSAQRLHLWDGTSIRRVGLERPDPPNVADDGAGTYPATLRYYKVALRLKVAGETVAQSNTSVAQAFTPSGAGLRAQITNPGTNWSDENATHWVLYGSPDDSFYQEIVELAIGTTTYNDTANPLDYDGDSAAEFGAFTPPPMATMLLADDARIILAGVPQAKQRVYWTSILGATDLGDDERVSATSVIKSYTDMDEPVTGIGGPVLGSIFVFSRFSRWKMVATGNVANPYNRFKITGGVGCWSHKSIVIAEDEQGAPCMYWLSDQGPYRHGNFGQQSMIDDIADIWDSVNREATYRPHGVFHKDLHQIWWWIPVNGSNFPNVRIVFDTRLGRVVPGGSVRKGWVRASGQGAAAYSSVMMSNTLGASTSSDLKPYVGKDNKILKCDSGTTDNGDLYQAYVDTRPYTPQGLGATSGTVENAVLSAKVQAGVEIQLSFFKDFELNPVNTAVATLDAATVGDARCFPVFEDSRVADVNAIQYRVGDAAAIDNTWNLDAIVIPTKGFGTR